MIVTCPSCAARYKLDDGKVTGRGAKIKCPSCRFVFIVYPQSSSEEEAVSAKAEAAPVVAAAAGAVASAAAPAAVAEAGVGASAVIQRPRAVSAAVPAPAAVAAPAPRRSADSLEFRKVGIASWKVRVKFGLVYDFSDIRTLRKYIQDGKVTADDVISHDGQRWVIIGDIPDLDGYFIKVYEEAEEGLKSAAKEKGGGFEDDESPTMIVGMGTLASDLAADALRQATAPSNPATPNPPTPSGDAQFVDPFAALKSKQRDRIQKRRAATTTPVAAPSPTGNRAAPVAVVILLLLVGGGWWYTHRAPPLKPAQTTNPTTDPTAAQTAAGEAAARDIRALVDNSLSASAHNNDEAPEPDEEPTLVPVGPGAQGGRPTNTNSGGSAVKSPANGGSTAPPAGAITTSAMTPQDHLAACQDLSRSRTWSAAVSSCRNAVDGGAGGADAVALLGIALYETRDLGGASQKLGQAAKQGTSVREVRKYLGHIARDNGDTAGAIGYYQQYVDGNPADKATIDEEIRKLTGS